jgi:hypothetical protein
LTTYLLINLFLIKTLIQNDYYNLVVSLIEKIVDNQEIWCNILIQLIFRDNKKSMKLFKKIVGKIEIKNQKIIMKILINMSVNEYKEKMILDLFNIGEFDYAEIAKSTYLN